MMKQLRIYLVLCGAFVVASMPVAAQSLDAGLTAYKAGDYEAALTELTPVAERGVADAQHRLAVMYLFGQGVEADPAEALRWVRAAAEQGHIKAQSQLSYMHFFGIGTEKDAVAAAKWSRAAAEAGDAVSQRLLATFYRNGTGVPRNIDESVRWLDKAARQGDGDALLMLGVAYERGAGVPRDLVRAQAMYLLAVERDIDGAVRNRDHNAEKLDEAQRRRAEMLAAEFDAASRK